MPASDGVGPACHPREIPSNSLPGSGQRPRGHWTSAADQPWEKQGLLRGRVEAACYRRFSGRSAHGGGKARTGQLYEALLRLQKRLRIVRIEIVPGVATVVHDDL